MGQLINIYISFNEEVPMIKPKNSEKKGKKPRVHAAPYPKLHPQLPISTAEMGLCVRRHAKL
jgi:hypothetical protein